MALWLQHLLVLLAVLACGTFIVWQTVRSLSGKATRVGSCCAKGCAGSNLPANRKAAKRVIFLPVELLAQRPKAKR